MAQARSAREGFGFAGPLWLDLRDLVGRYFPDTERVRRLLPFLLAGFAAVAILGFAVELISGKRAAFADAEHRLELIADGTAANLKDKKLKPDSDWQKALADSLPKRALGMEPSFCLLTSKATSKPARRSMVPRATFWPCSAPNSLSPPSARRPASCALPSSTEPTLLSPRATCRDSQLAFIQPVDAALADWRQGARLEITLLVLTGLVLALLAGGLWNLAPTSARARKQAASPGSWPSPCPAAACGGGISPAAM